MKRSQRQMVLLSLFSCLLAGACLSVGMVARAQDDSTAPFTNNESDDSGRANASEGPVRLARFTYLKGNVTWRTDENASWSNGTINLPLRQGAQIWVTDGGRAEIQFDDGSLLRLGNNAVATLQTLYSDNEGEFTEIKLTDGLASLNLKHDHSIFQMDTPLISVKATGPAKLRIGAGDGVEVGVRSGQATVEGAQGKATLQSGDFLDLRDDNSPYDLRALPREDNWEQWNIDRDLHLDEAEQGYREHHLPSNIALVATDLDTYGSWRDDPTYGSVWCPRVTSASWRPYYYGHWTWVDPFGWTWVSEEPWGWAPYHYGTWVSASYGWAWVPGPVHQYWCPGAVHFSEFDGRVAWCPLSPSEVRYPSYLSIGFRSGNWFTYFSIGQAAVYYPGYSSYAVSRPFRNGYVNHVKYGHNITNINNYNSRPNAFNRYQNSAESFAANNNTYLNSHFVPMNARNGKGITVASASAFGGRGQYEPATAASAALFQRGRLIGAPPAGRAPVAGPIAIKPTQEAITPTRTFVTGMQPTKNALDRPVYRMPVNPNIERSSAPINTWNAGAGASRLNNRTGRPSNLNSGGGITGSGRSSATGVGSILPGRTPSERTVNPAGRTPNERVPGLPGRSGAGSSASGISGGASNTGGAPPRRDISPGSTGVRDHGTSGLSADQEAALRARRSLGIGDGSSRSRARIGGSDTSGGAQTAPGSLRGNPTSPGSIRGGTTSGDDVNRRSGGPAYPPSSSSREYHRDSAPPVSRQPDYPRYDSGSGRSGGSSSTSRDSGYSGRSYGSGSSSRDSGYSGRSSGSGSSTRDSGSSGRSSGGGSSERSRGSSDSNDSGSGGSSPNSSRGRGR